MAGLSLITKGFIAPVSRGRNNIGGGAPPVYKDENLPKPFIKVEKVSIKGDKKESFTEDTIKVKNIKIIVDQKD